MNKLSWFQDSKKDSCFKKLLDVFVFGNPCLLQNLDMFVLKDIELLAGKIPDFTSFGKRIYQILKQKCLAKKMWKNEINSTILNDVNSFLENSSEKKNSQPVSQATKKQKVEEPSQHLDARQAQQGRVNNEDRGDQRLILNPDHFQIKINSPMEMSSSGKDGRSKVHYTFSQLNQAKIQKINKDLLKLTTFIKTTKTPNLFCDFKYSSLNKDKIQIIVHQRNDFNAKAEGEPFDLIPLIKELFRGYLSLGRCTEIQSLINNWWKMLTINSITLGRSLKINIVQGFLQSRLIEGQQSGKYLANLLQKMIGLWEKEKKVRMEGVKTEDLNHLLNLLREKSEFSTKQPRQQMNELQTILEKHPLFLSASEKRMLIHDASDFSQYLRNKEILNYYGLKRNQRDNLVKPLDDRIDYQAYMQNINNSKEKLAIYSWIKPQFVGLVKQFNKRAKDEQQRQYVAYKDHSFRDQLRFFRNLIFHAYSYKKQLEGKLMYEHSHPDCLLERIEHHYPRFLTFVYDSYNIQRALLEQLLKKSSLKSDIDLQLVKFVPKRDVNRKEKMSLVFGQLLYFTSQEIWDYFKCIKMGENVIKDNWGQNQLNQLREKLPNANLRINMKLNQFKKHFKGQGIQYEKFKNKPILVHKDYDLFGSLMAEFLPQPSIFIMYLKIYFIIENRKEQAEQLMRDCLEADCLWLVYSALLSWTNKEEVDMDSLQLAEIKCPDYFKTHCPQNNKCPYFHPNGACYDFIAEGKCPDLSKCDEFHPQLCKEGKNCNNKNCWMKHLPICPDFYYDQCKAPYTCKKKQYHPPVWICNSFKVNGNCLRDYCKYYHPQKAQIPVPVSFGKKKSAKQLKKD